MCEAFLLSYSGAVNGVTDSATDLIPTVLGFRDADCGGVMVAPGVGAVTDFPSQELGGDVVYNFSGVRSLVVPFNYPVVQLLDNQGHQCLVWGGTTWPDLNILRFEGTNTPASAVVHLKVPKAHALPWDTWLKGLCMNATYTMGPYAMTRYQPQGDRCDAFMSTYCSQSQNATADLCACFAARERLAPTETKVGATLPPLCFDQACAEKNSYRTAGMVGQQCNGVVCQQIIRTHGTDLPSTEQAHVYCGASYYDPSSAAPVPSARTAGGNVVPGDDSDAPADSAALPPTTLSDPNAFDLRHQPLYVYVMLAMTAVMMFVLVFLLFSPGKVFPPEPLSSGLAN